MKDTDKGFALRQEELKRAEEFIEKLEKSGVIKRINSPEELLTLRGRINTYSDMRYNNETDTI